MVVGVPYFGFSFLFLFFVCFELNEFFSFFFFLEKKRNTVNVGCVLHRVGASISMDFQASQLFLSSRGDTYSKANKHRERKKERERERETERKQERESRDKERESEET